MEWYLNEFRVLFRVRLILESNAKCTVSSFFRHWITQPWKSVFPWSVISAIMLIPGYLNDIGSFLSLHRIFWRSSSEGLLWHKYARSYSVTVNCVISSLQTILLLGPATAADVDGIHGHQVNHCSSALSVTDFPHHVLRYLRYPRVTIRVPFMRRGTRIVTLG